MVRLEVAHSCPCDSLQQSVFPSRNAMISTPEIHQKDREIALQFPIWESPSGRFSQQIQPCGRDFCRLNATNAKYFCTVVVCFSEQIKRHHSRCLVSVNRNHFWNEVTSSISASRVIGLCGAMDKHPAPSGAQHVSNDARHIEQDDGGVPR